MGDLEYEFKQELNSPGLLYRNKRAAAANKEDNTGELIQSLLDELEARKGKPKVKKSIRRNQREQRDRQMNTIE